MCENVFRCSVSSGVSQWLYIDCNLLSQHLWIPGQRVGVQTRVQLIRVRIRLTVHIHQMFNDKRRVWMMLWLCSCVVVANMKTAHWQWERCLWCACWISLRSSSVMWTATLSPFVPVTMATTSQWCWIVTMCLKNTVRAGRHVKGRNLTKEHNLLISLMCMCCSTSAGSL